MKKITEEQCLNLLKERFPNFIPYWDSSVSCWETTEGMLAQMIPFSQYAEDVLKNNNIVEIKNIFDFVEFLLCGGNESVRNGIATCFLEYLFNIDAAGIKFTSFCQYLGKKSLDYCRVWDKLCGNRTEGLWPTSCKD